MKQEFEVSVEELLRTLQRRGIPLASEMGAFITLEVCEQIIDRPIQVSAQEIAINEIGEVLCGPQPTPADEEEAVRALLLLLGDLLVCAAPGVPTMLLELVERGPNAPELTLDRLRDELEACLLPLNRGATRRVLARLLREARKAGPSLRSGSQPTAADIDAQFDALLGTSPGTEPAIDSAATTPRAGVPVSPAPRAAAAPVSPAPRAAAAPGAQPARAKRSDETPVTEPFAGSGSPASRNARARELDAAVVAARKRSSARSTTASDELETIAQEPALALALEPESDEDEPVASQRAAAREPASQTRPARMSRSPDVDSLIEDEPKRSSLGVWAFAGCLIAALGLVATYMALGRDGTRGALGLLPQPNVSPPPTAASVHPAAPQVGELHVNSNPPRAQVFLLIGTGPALATDLPLGVAQEFVALAEGYAPARALVPADVSWEEVDGKPRYELAMQAARSSVDPAKLGLGKTLLPQDVGSPQARLGSVRIVTTPRGAKVYQLIGFTPDVRVENLPLDQSYEVLVYAEGKALVTKQLTAADFPALDGKHTAELDITLAAAKAR